MNRMVFGSLLALAVLATSTLSAQAALIGSFTSNGSSSFSLDGGGAFQGATAVTFNLDGVGSFQATLTFNGQLAAGTGDSGLGSVGQEVSSLSFQIVGAGGENYLSGSTDAGLLAGIEGAGTANFQASTQGSVAGAITFTSDYLLFPDGNRSFNLSLSDLLNSNPPGGTGLTLNGSNLNAAAGSTASGNFSTDVAPIPVPVVPEPATLTLLGLGGVFAAGAARLRRRK